jgi:rhodanese-related sulfurtransferase
LEWRLDPLGDHRIPESTDHDQRIVIGCNEGFGSDLAAASLPDLGVRRATDLIGGFRAWLAVVGRQSLPETRALLVLGFELPADVTAG